MTRRFARSGLLAARFGVLLIATLVVGHAETFITGQPVYPAFEGWERNADGSFNLVFGYMNENWQQELNIPVGPGNNFEPGGPDRGQPTHFLPRRNRFVFRIAVPKDFGNKELVWSVTANGKTERAYGSLRPDLFLETIDLMSETGALGAGVVPPGVRENRPPEIALAGMKTLTAKVGEPVTIDAVVTDDGIPRPGATNRARFGTVAPVVTAVHKGLGLHLSWFVYRGAGRVQFEPAQIKVWEDTRAGANSPWAPIWSAPPVPPDHRYQVRVTFFESGTYVLAARADDGALSTDEFVTVHVTN